MSLVVVRHGSGTRFSDAHFLRLLVGKSGPRVVAGLVIVGKARLCRADLTK